MSPYKSPSTIIRSVKRMTKFIEGKHDNVSSISLVMLPQIHIQPDIKTLSFTKQESISILSSPKLLSLTNTVQTDIPPDCSQNELPFSNDELIRRLLQFEHDLKEARKGYTEMKALKDEQIQILKNQILTLPAQILSQFQQQFQPP
eukprot:GFUD01136458.1.p1 GENE.GFUD01136458.1~~GFUD01136458.1.p1  ORF type:complete len:146 (+),score=26.71 GFUD01136458.1:355-792(+)